MKKYFIISVVMSLFTLVSCSDKSSDNVEEKRTVQGFLESHIDFELKDNKGNNLLLNKDYTIDVIYFDAKGKEHIFYDKDLADPKGYSNIHEDKSVRLYLKHPDWNTKSGKHTAETFVKFNKGKLEVFKCEFEVNKGYIVRQKVWLNDKLIWHKKLENPVKPIVIIR